MEESQRHMWNFVRLMVTERSRVVAPLLQHCESVSPNESSEPRKGELTLARMFPLFGLSVALHTLTVKAGAVETVGGDREGIVVHESASDIGVVLLSDDASLRDPLVAWLSLPANENLDPPEAASCEPRVVKVPKMFPGGSGTLMDLFPKLTEQQGTLIAVVRGKVGRTATEESEPFPLNGLRGRCL